ncbi:hypothetical protein N0V86_006152 [Didymella sp. IMI 355093]|nr:hypothetical protein N0V86_006152 [Didymella sp. IMI 355093]
MHSTFVLSLLATAVSAQLSAIEKHVGSLALSASSESIKESCSTAYPTEIKTFAAAQLPPDSLLPSFEFATSGATITPPSTSINRPATSINRPATSINRPATSINRPATSINRPATSTTPPSTSITPPSTSSTSCSTSITSRSTSITSPLTSIPATALPSIKYTAEFSVSIPTEISSQVAPTNPVEYSSCVSASIPTEVHSQTAPTNPVQYTSAVSASIPTEVPSQAPGISIGLPGISIGLPGISIGLSIGIDQPNPSATFDLPASESFNPTNAPAFTKSTDIPNPTIGPASSTTPCSSEITATPVPATSTPCTEEGEAPISTPVVIEIPTPTPEVPVETPEASEVPAASTPCTEEGKAPASTPAAIQTPTPTPKVPSGAEETPCSEELQATATGAGTEVPTFTPLPTEVPVLSPISTGVPSRNSSRPSPTGNLHHAGRPGFGWGRPYPFAWHGRPRPTRSFGPRPSASAQPEKHDFGPSKASSTPCTLETRVRPTATGAAY